MAMDISEDSEELQQLVVVSESTSDPQIQWVWQEPPKQKRSDDPGKVRHESKREVRFAIDGTPLDSSSVPTPGSSPFSMGTLSSELHRASVDSPFSGSIHAPYVAPPGFCPLSPSMASPPSFGASSPMSFATISPPGSNFSSPPMSPPESPPLSPGASSSGRSTSPLRKSKDQGDPRRMSWENQKGHVWKFKTHPYSFKTQQHSKSTKYKFHYFQGGEPNEGGCVIPMPTVPPEKKLRKTM